MSDGPVIAQSRSWWPILVPLWSAAVGHALAAEEEATPSASHIRLLDEIIVTAQKRSESLQAVPIAVTAISGEALDQAGITDFAALGARTPSLSFSEATGEAQLYIRGIGSNLNLIGSDPSVAVHLDGVYLARANMGLSQFLDVDRVEVLRGPQGTLYGRNATGGAINVISNMPTPAWEGYVSALVGSFSDVGAKAAVGGPLSDTVSFRLAGRIQADEGFTDDLDSRGANQIDDKDIRAFRGILQWDPVDTVRLRFSADFSDFQSANTSIRPIDDRGAAAVLGAVPTTSLNQTRNDLGTFHDWETTGLTATLDWNIGAATLTSISGYREFDADFLFNTDGTEIDVTRTTLIIDTTQYSQELRLAGDSGPLTWVAGAYYLKEEKTALSGLVRANLVPGRTFIIPAKNDSEATALFAQGTYQVSPRWSITAGIRYSHERKEDENTLHLVFADPQADPDESWKDGSYTDRPYGPPILSRVGPASESWDDWSPKLSIEYAPKEDVLLYASYTEGFKSGGYNDAQPTNPVYQPEYIESFELGAKLEWPASGVRLNVAAFQYDYTDLQVLSFLNGLNVVTNAADSTVRGLEVDGLWQPSDALAIGVSLALLDATYDDFTATYGVCTQYAIEVVQDANCQGINPFTGSAFVPGAPRPVTANGNSLNNAPEFKGSLDAQYRIALPGGSSFALFGQVTHRGEIFFNPANDPVARQGPMTLVDARLSYQWASQPLEVSLIGKNLTDEKYYRNIVQFTSTSLPPPAVGIPPPTTTITDPLSIGHALGYPGPGRTWTLEATYRFGL